MANKRDEIVAKIKNMTPNEMKSNAPAETPRMRRRKFWSKVKRVADALDIDLGGTSSKTGGHSHHGGNVGPSHPTPASFREEHHFDPERAYWERAQERSYFSRIDGKGDAKPHNCDHEH